MFYGIHLQRHTPYSPTSTADPFFDSRDPPHVRVAYCNAATPLEVQEFCRIRFPDYTVMQTFNPSECAVSQYTPAIAESVRNQRSTANKG